MTLTDTGTRIEMPLLDYSKRRNTIKKECFLMLYNDYITYKVVGTAEELDSDTGIWVEKEYNYRWSRKRSFISDVNMYFDNKENAWSTGLDFQGIDAGNDWMFASPKEALRIYNILQEYMIG